MAGIETEPKEPAPSLARIFDQLAEKATEVSSSGPSSSFVSCLRINGRPLLGPLMTPERRLQCQTWKMQAIERETMLKKKQVRREKTISCVKSPEESTGEEDCEYEEDFDSSTSSSSSSSSSDSEDEDDGESVVIMPRSRTAAFKSLIHRLRHDHHESTQSINTVIENPDFSPSHSVTSTSSPPPPMRERSGSYTLDEPSPLLRAYMQRFGNVDMSQSPKTTMMGPPITRKVLPSPGELNDSRGKAEHLQQYLAHLSTMPERLSVGSKPPKCSSPPKKTTNPPTPKEDRSEKSGFLSAKDENDLVSVPRLELEENPSVASSAMNSMSLNIETPASAQYPSLPSEKIDSARSLVSEMTSLTIEAPSSSEPPTMIETTTSQRTYTNCPSDAPTPMIASPSVTLNLPSTLNTARSESTSATTTNREIEEAVSCLAQEQQRRVQRLMEQQSKQREELKRMFEEQQKKLIGEIMSTVKPPASVLQPILNPSPSELPSWALRSPRPLSPVVPAMQSHVRPISTLPLDYKFPTEVENRENHLKLCKLSALAKGYLTRRLMKTTKVQDITSSIRETMNTALKLHQEAKLAARPVSSQDLDLHARLLAQLNKDYQTFHDIFFRLGTAERMSIIALDQEIRSRPVSNPGPEAKRVSAVTKAKLEEKERKMQRLLSVDLIALGNRSSPKRRRIRSLTRVYEGSYKANSSKETTGKARRHTHGARRSLVYSTESNSHAESSRHQKSRRQIALSSRPFSSSSRMSSSASSILVPTSRPQIHDKKPVQQKNRKPWK